MNDILFYHSLTISKGERVLTVLVCAAIAALASLVVAIKNKFEGGEIFFSVFFCGLLGAALGVILMLFVTTVAPRIEIKQELKLVAFRDDSSTVGSFFLGSGNIEGKDVYLFYRQNENGDYVRDHVSANKAVIREENRTDGVLEVHYQTVKDSWLLWTQYDAEFNLHYIFCVPKGTVIRQFQADLSN